MYPRMIAASREMNDVLEQIDAVAPFDVSVFLSGESGTGKELAAQRLHGESSRARFSFVAVNCAALPDSLLESELFGHTRGAFTGAHQSRDGLLQRADGGTLFLDEVADLPTRAQTTLLRTLQEKEYRRLGDSAIRRSNFRLVSASHKDLDAEVAAGRFRLDLLFRLRVVQVALPPLRDRPMDIIALAKHYSSESTRKLGLPPRRLSRGAERALLAYSWPGNVRELENEIVHRPWCEPAPVMSSTMSIFRRACGVGFRRGCGMLRGTLRGDSCKTRWRATGATGLEPPNRWACHGRGCTGN